MQLRSQEDAELRQELRQGRSFSLSEVIGREGGDFLKGDDAIPRPLRARAMIQGFLAAHLVDPEGALQVVLQLWIQDDVRVSRRLDAPLVALEEILRSLSQPPDLYEFSRQVNMKWGEIYGERPRFQRPGEPSHPEIVYSHEQVKAVLAELLVLL